MRIALCLFGIIGGTKGKNGKGDLVDYKLCYEYYLKNILNYNEVDVFIHTWSVDYLDDLISLYQPKLALGNNQEDYGFINTSSEHRVLSRWDSNARSLQLKRNYEDKHNFKYDAAMVARFDLMFLKPLIFNKYDMQYFWASHWNLPPLNKTIKKLGHINKADKSNRSEVKNGYSDLWFFSNSTMMDYLSLVFDSMKKSKINLSQHKGAWEHLNLKYNPKEITRYTLYRWYDFELYRWKELGCYE